MAISATLLAAFERFWAAYPARPDNPKAAAREVFARRVREGADPEAIVAAAGRYADLVARLKRDPNFIQHARTWLSQRRYEDFQEAAATPAPAADASHPLAWLEPIIGADAWASWIAPLVVEDGLITARTRLALDHVRRNWGALIEERRRHVTWTHQPKETPDAR